MFVVVWCRNSKFWGTLASSQLSKIGFDMSFVTMEHTLPESTSSDILLFQNSALWCDSWYSSFALAATQLSSDEWWVLITFKYCSSSCYLLTVLLFQGCFPYFVLNYLFPFVVFGTFAQKVSAFHSFCFFPTETESGLLFCSYPCPQCMQWFNWFR